MLETNSILWRLCVGLLLILYGFCVGLLLILCGFCVGLLLILCGFCVCSVWGYFWYCVGSVLIFFYSVWVLCLIWNFFVDVIFLLAYLSYYPLHFAPHNDSIHTDFTHKSHTINIDTLSNHNVDAQRPPQKPFITYTDIMPKYCYLYLILIHFEISFCTKKINPIKLEQTSSYLP